MFSDSFKPRDDGHIRIQRKKIKQKNYVNNEWTDHKIAWLANRPAELIHPGKCWCRVSVQI